jgi:hypothetical protein
MGAGNPTAVLEKANTAVRAKLTLREIAPEYLNPCLGIESLFLNLARDFKVVLQNPTS